jgi:hypothetical protein
MRGARRARSATIFRGKLIPDLEDGVSFIQHVTEYDAGAPTRFKPCLRSRPSWPKSPTLRCPAGRDECNQRRWLPLT